MSAKAIVGIVIAGVVLMLFGGMLGHAMDQVWKYPSGDDDKWDTDHDGSADDADDYKDIDQAQDNFEDRRTTDRALENIGTYLFLFGIVLLLIGLLLGGLLCEQLPDLVRLGCVVAVGLLVFYWV
jgi:MFS superfamily sulfate permease-like transporter